VSTRSIGAVRILAVAALLAAASMSSCAYFNTLYNARKIFREAEKASGKEGGGREQRDKYRQVVKKCSQMIADHPKSRWVDDAVFLMGQALFRQEDYDKAIRQFQEILTDFPESGYVPHAVYWLGLSYYMKKDDAQALTYVDRFLKEYPKQDLRFDVLFLGGDIKREMEDDDGALDFYGRVAEDARKRETVDQARLKCAELFRARGDWAKAAANYEKALHKGITWETRREISLSLGECYTKTGKCREALALFDGLVATATATQDVPPLLLGRAASYACMDSLAKALAVYTNVATKYPKSTYSAEAYYRMGVIYHERLDSLALAQAAFGKVAGEYSNSDFAAPSLEKSTSMKRLLELQKAAGKGETADQAAEKRFMAAEIQLTRLGDIQTALAGYRAVLDSFPLAAVAPKAAYAIAWIHEYKLNDKDMAIQSYRALVSRFPRSYQARGAIFQLGFLGADSLRTELQAYVDSARADTTAIEKPASAAPASPDTARAKPVAVPPPPQPSNAHPVVTPAILPARADTAKKGGTP
jgi:TolA-binding protein